MRTQTSIFLRDVALGQEREAQLICGLALDEVDVASVLWSLDSTSLQQTPMPQHLHWDWSLKARTVQGFSNYLFAGVQVDGEMQGLVLWDELFTKAKHPAQLGKDLLYISFLATAPWNDRNMTTTPRFVGIGTLLLLAAIDKSVEMEYRGRLGLHALPQSEAFYRKCGFTDLGPDLSHDSLRYFEFTPDQATLFEAKFGVQR